MAQLRKGAGMAMQNSEGLIRDAEILYANGRWARCRFLCAIAIEELGKYLMLMSAMVQVARGEMDWKRFWKRFRQHQEKSGNILAFDKFLSPFDSAVQTVMQLRRTLGEAKQAEAVKMEALYVDFSKNGFTLPHERVDESMALEDLEGAKAVFKFFDANETVLYGKLDSMTDDQIRDLVLKGGGSPPAIQHTLE